MGKGDKNVKILNCVVREKKKGEKSERNFRGRIYEVWEFIGYEDGIGYYCKILCKNVWMDVVINRLGKLGGRFSYWRV